MKKFRFLIVIVLLMFIVSCSKTPVKETTAEGDGKFGSLLTVSVIDVGQGDAILIKTPDNKHVLIDCGSRDDRNKFFDYLEAQKIQKLDYIIGTHPHEDHIGNLEEVIKNYEIGDIYMPRVTSNSAFFKDLMEEISLKNLKIKRAFSGVSFNEGEVSFRFCAPNSNEYDNVNNYSAVVRMVYKNTSFIFMGDAEKLSEKEILSQNMDIASDFIKIGHHGSTSSSSKKFIKTVNPTYAVISCGKNNDYGHPHAATLKLLEDLNIKLYRTDLDGTVVFTSDGSKIEVNK